MPAMQQVAGVTDDLLQVLGHREDAERNLSKFDTAHCSACKTKVGMHSCVTGGSSESIHAAICAGMGRKVAYRAPTIGISSSTKISFVLSDKSSTYSSIHRSSLVTDPSDWIVFCDQMISPSGAQTLSSVANINLCTALLFSTWTKFYIGDGTVIIGNGIGVKLHPQTLVALRKLKSYWEASLIQDTTTLGEHFIQIISQLIAM